ncbi:MAG: hypothetical protein PHO26_04325 [Dehalococcoidia bacterium]|nr:hypothetical protein [Dehalococcoidia bacterium]MDD5493897.1 hypothetical protein [Dehalococcoidia bacterium]
MSRYPRLSLRQGYSVKRAVERFIGGDTIGYVTAIHTATDVGFVVESMNSAQGGFLFAPIKSAEEALEYANFMFHEPPFSAYSREHVDIYNQQDLDEALSGWKDYKVLKNPPTDITRVTRQNDGKYSVELVFRCYLGKQRIEYMSCLVDSEGNLEALEYYIYVEGPWGAAL